MLRKGCLLAYLVRPQQKWKKIFTQCSSDCVSYCKMFLEFQEVFPPQKKIGSAAYWPCPLCPRVTLSHSLGLSFLNYKMGVDEDDLEDVSSSRTVNWLNQER